jgi:hypothetical protein
MSQSLDIVGIDSARVVVQLLCTDAGIRCAAAPSQTHRIVGDSPQYVLCVTSAVPETLQTQMRGCSECGHRLSTIGVMLDVCGVLEVSLVPADFWVEEGKFFVLLALHSLKKSCAT